MKKGGFFKMIFSGDTSLMVRERGLEPLCPKTPEPKSGASANSATRAQTGFNYRKFLRKTQATVIQDGAFSRMAKLRSLFAELARANPARCPAWRLLEQAKCRARCGARGA